MYPLTGSRMRTNSSNRKDVWQTPPELTELLTDISLDPCAAPDTDIGDTNWTEQDDGLSREWFGHVFVNPPFSTKNEWIKKCVDEQENTDCIYLLTPDSTDVKKWWHRHIAPNADYIWFSEGRIKFIDPSSGDRGIGKPTFGTAISMFGEPHDEILENFQQNGHLVKTVTNI